MTSDVKVMETKKAQKNAKTVDSAPTGKAVVSFVGDIKEEFKKITWTSQDELKSYTKIVIGATFILGMAILLVDLSIQGALDALGTLVRLIIG